ncbi:hypothetical protein D9611_010044 [Ephemerocybe angulata]|uniref:DUF6589 domain-containing protein n=1 Tax=Ephemerocybe angulata TaxID=980116 RepID=A0A8H5FFR4_9AGAR|nr:hypothetical protein D9611_010044 [Tulosesus angulatus]
MGRSVEQKLKASDVWIKANGWRSTNEYVQAYYSSPSFAPQALRHDSNASYKPVEILDSWMKNAPSKEATNALNAAVMKHATAAIIKESDSALNDPELSLPALSITISRLANNFGLETVQSIYLSTLPCLALLLTSIMTAPNNYERWNHVEKEGKHDRAAKAMVIIISMMLFIRNRGTNVVPTIIGVFLASTGASRRLIDTFHHMGLSTSYMSIQRCLTALSLDAKEQARIFVSSSDRLWGVVYDNINFTLRASSQRLDSTTRQINATTLAVFSLPVSFTRATYQAALALLDRNKTRQERKKFTLQSLSPMDPKKHANVMKAFEYAVATILLNHIPGEIQKEQRNRRLRSAVAPLKPVIRVLSHEKTKFYPLPALNEEEASTQGTARVVKKIFLELLNLTADVVDTEIRLMVGDWLTIRNLRLIKAECKHEFTKFLRFDWIQEAAMPFHFQMNAMYCIYRTYYGTISQNNPSALDSQRTHIHRAKLDPKKPEYHLATEVGMHSLTARLLDCLRIELDYKSFGELKNWKPDTAEFLGVVKDIVAKYPTSAAAADALALGDEVKAHSLLFMRDMLFFWEFCDAIRDADVGRMWVVYDFWVLMFRGAGCHNYANELLEMKAQFEYEFPPLLRDVVERTWLVNRWGIAGRSIPTDLYLEHNNGFTKNMFAALGSCASIEYIQEKGSACVEVLRSFSMQMSSWFGRSEFNRGHREVAAAADIAALSCDMVIHQMHETRPNRRITVPAATSRSGKSKPSKPAVCDVFYEGWRQLGEKKMFEQWKSRTLGIITMAEAEKMAEDAALNDQESSEPSEGFSDPDGVLDVDTALDEEFADECPFSNVNFYVDDPTDGR